MSVTTRLYPTIIPDVISGLLSSDDKLATETRSNLQQILSEAKQDPKDHNYMNNVSMVIDGKVAEIDDLKARLKNKATDFDAINEEGALVVGTLLSAISQNGNLANMALLASAVAAAIKVAFKVTKWFYSGRQSKQLTDGTTLALQEGTEEGIRLWKESYHEDLTKATEQVIADLSKRAIAFTKAEF